MKYSEVLKKIAEISKILCKIIYVACIVSICISVLGIIVVIAFGTEGFAFDKINILPAIKDLGSNPSALIAYLICVALISIGNMVAAKFAGKYFDNALKDGNPFSKKGSKELLHTGIIVAAVPLGCTMIASLLSEVAKSVLSVTNEFDFDCSFSVILGVMFILISVILGYGSDLLEGKTESEKTEEQ